MPPTWHTMWPNHDSILKFIHSFIHSLVFSPRGQSGRSQSPVVEPIWLLAHCILGKFLGVVCHCFPPPLDVPTFTATCLCVHSDARDPSSETWNCGWERCPVVILPKFWLPHIFRDLLHAIILRHGTDNFTSPPKEAYWGFFRPKNPTASAGFEPTNLGTKGQHAISRPPKLLTLKLPCLNPHIWVDTNN